MPNKRKRLQGVVVGNKMDKTVKVSVETIKSHPLYGKIIRTNKNYMAHDETNDVQVGDVVRIVESRPVSKTKRWVVEEVVESASAGDVLPDGGVIDVEGDVIEGETADDSN
jgi:small subunit ribosomal protein S17